MRIPTRKEIGALFASKPVKDSTGKNRIGDDKLIISKIIDEFSDKTRKSIKDWRSALDAYDDPIKPKSHLLQDLYEYLSPDAHMQSQVDILKGTILSNRFLIRDSKSGQENADKSKQFEKQWFYLFMSDLLDSITHAYTVLQLTNPEMMSFENIPRRNIIPKKDFVLLKTTEEDGVYYTDPYYANVIVVLKNTHKYGIMNDLVPQLIYKKYAEQAWAKLSERWGLPLLTATTNKRDKKTLDLIESMLKKLGQAAEAVLPEGTTMKAEYPANQTDPYRLFDTRIERSNTEISKRILGGTMISDNGSSRSQSEVHERTLNNILGEQYRKMIEFVVNDQLLPIMRFWGRDISETDEFVFDRSQQLTINDKWKIVEGVSKLYDIDQDWVSSTFNIPILREKKTNPPPGFNKPTNALALALVGKGITFPQYKAGGDKGRGVKMSVFPGDKILTQLSELILEYLWAGKDTLVQQLEKSILAGSFYRDGLFDGWGKRRMSIGYDAVDHRALSSMEYNLFHFSAAREKASVFTLNELLQDKENNGIKSFADFKKAAEPHLVNMNKNYLETEYNFSVSTGQNASRYQQFIEEIQTVTSYVIYQTVGDSNVRPKHAALDGKVFSLNDPEARRLWPPNDFGCRCEFLQYLDSDVKKKLISGKEGLKLMDWDDKKEKMFGVNRGDIGEVFLQNQMYIQNHDFADDISAMTYDKYGLDKAAIARKNKPALKVDKTITEKNAGDLFIQEEKKDYMGFKDYLSRAITLSKRTFEQHTTGKYIKESRHQLFPYVKDVLDNPDEVYFNEWKDKKFQTNYVKHYKNMSLVVNTNLAKKNLEITTWYEMKNEKEVRKGLLIHQKKKP